MFPLLEGPCPTSDFITCPVVLGSPWAGSTGTLWEYWFHKK